MKFRDPSLTAALEASRRTQRRAVLEQGRVYTLTKAVVVMAWVAAKAVEKMEMKEMIELV